MADQKLDNLLNLALDATEEEREKSANLSAGSEKGSKLWDVIIKYSGDIEALSGDGIRAVPLLGGFAVVSLPQNKIREFAGHPQVEFVELPKRLYFQVRQGLDASCFRSVQGAGEANGLSGKGVLVGIVDSGVDWRHPDFCNEDGTSRILSLWDQSAQPEPGQNPPKGYLRGVEYTGEEINRALSLPDQEGNFLVRERDLSGHGTSVLGIAAGNGRASGGVNRGAAYASDIVAVKMGIPGENSFPRTVELMEGVDYLIRQAQILGKPMALNVSFGNNYGSHEPYN